MISFRFHLVSLVAVFLALGLGVLTGTTVLNRGIVVQLQRQHDQLAADAQGLREQVGELQADLETWSAFGSEVTGHLVDGRLTGQEVVMLTQEGTDDRTLNAVRQTLAEAGAEVEALLSVGARMALPQPDDSVALAGILGVSSTGEPEELVPAAADAVSDRLAFGASPGTDVLDDLLRGGFLVSRGSGLGSAAVEDLGGNGELVVVVAGGLGASSVEPPLFLVPLVEGLAASGVGVAATEPTTTADPYVVELRGGDMSDRIATQDNVDRLPGEVGLILALEDLAAGQAGHYGVKAGASRLIPEL